jgi:hypothetical protein
MEFGGVHSPPVLITPMSRTPLAPILVGNCPIVSQMSQF